MSPNLINCRFGRLIIKSIYHAKCGLTHAPKAECQCDCGNISHHWLSHVKRGNIISCGCFQKDHPNSRKHGLSQHPLYGVWSSMIGRCHSLSHKQYVDYGGRGIYVCQDWLFSFENFYLWMMNEGWHKECRLSLDRIDNDNGYLPQNCRLATSIQQGNNKRTNVKIAAFGEVKTMSEWARDSRCKVSLKCFHLRISRYNMNPEQAIVTPSRKKYESTV